MAVEYRAIFEYPTPWDGPDTVSVGYGSARETREEAERDRPVRSEETHGYRAGIQSRIVEPWVTETEPTHRRQT